MFLPGSGSPPDNRYFFDHLIKVLGPLLDFQVGHLVKMTDDVIQAVIQVAGFDPMNLSQYGDPNAGWVYDGRSNPPGLRRRVLLAYRFLYERSIPLTLSDKPRGMWGLTEAGIEAARRLCPVPQPVVDPPKSTKNLTSTFLDQRIRATGGLQGGLCDLMRRAISAHMPISAASHMVEDHMQNCMMRLVKRDALRTRILEGMPITDEQLATYAVRGAYNDARNSGTDPVSREMYGARTERERAKGKKTGPISDNRLVWGRDEDSGEPYTWIDIADTGSSMSAEAMEDQLQLNDIMSVVVDHFKAKKPHAWARYVNVLNMKAVGSSLREIAAAENVGLFRAASMTAEMRRRLRDALKHGALDSLLEP